MTCATCGSANPAGQKFCGECGAALARTDLVAVAGDRADQAVVDGARRWLDERGSTPFVARLDGLLASAPAPARPARTEASERLPA